jgi:hypothetical protein
LANGRYWPNCDFGADGLVAVTGRRTSADRYAQHTCPSTPAGGQQGPTHTGSRRCEMASPKAGIESSAFDATTVGHTAGLLAVRTIQQNAHEFRVGDLACRAAESVLWKGSSMNSTI